MLLSMTGFGEARCQENGLAVAVEVRTINSRYFKLTIRSPEGYGSLEPQIDAVVRQQTKRGTIQVSVKIDRAVSPEDYRLNVTVLDGYRRQLESLYADWQVTEPVRLDAMLLLPGIVDEDGSRRFDAAADWPVIRSALEAAMDNLATMRAEEGQAMAADLRANCAAIAAELGEIERRAPLVVDAYRERLQDRLNNMLAELGVSLTAADLIKEVGIYAERSDISEEIVRLRSHLEQFQATIDLRESSGRKLEFLTQEMFREVNTIGSKANDLEIARHVIEIKSAIEKIREMIQNVE
ncbi:MAG: YicC/YloC family endoribonuclease [Pirellulales bacterium]